MLTVGSIYETAIIFGMAADPRGEKDAKRELERVKKRYKGLKKDEKEEFDKQKLKNPYADTRILYGDEKRVVERILVGIDMEIGEVLLADRLREKGKTIDLIISHHPEGYALTSFYEVMHMQADVLNKYGVPINIAEGVLKERIQEVERKVMPVNYNRAVDVARLFDIPFICVHTPCDNLVTAFLQKLFDKAKSETIKDIINELKDIPEYKQAVQDNAGPKILVGSEDNRAGKIFVEMTGGTEGSKEAIEKLANAGVGTIVTMHYSDKLRKEAEKYHINIVVAGHMASDTLGLNLFLDKLTKKDNLEIIACSGFRRIAR
ncbi:MAG: NGG1p interacting factor NIF3 [bacterium]|nr:NGG1p interacting factor NIF3 [bacterium]